MSKSIIVTTDCVLFGFFEDKLHYVLHKRENEPEKGKLALLGGYVHQEEDINTYMSIRRIILEKAGVHVPYLEQLYTFSGDTRDSRGWSISISYFAPLTKNNMDSLKDNCVLVPIGKDIELPFDHSSIVSKAINRLRDKSTYSTLPAFFLDEVFTISELHKIYESVLGVKLDKASFRRKMEDQNIIEEVKGERLIKACRPAQIYKLKTLENPSYIRQMGIN